MHFVLNVTNNCYELVLKLNKDAAQYSAQNWQFLAKTLGRNKIEICNIK